MGRQLPLVTSVLAGGLVLAGAFAARIQAQTQAPRFPNEITAIRFNAGQSVVPYFEGWIRNADGTFDMVFGYFNRNHVQEFSIPPGADNKIEPGLADSGQPTYFLPRRQRYVFRLRVPTDFGKQEVVWTITANGRTEKGYGSLIPPQEITERVVMTGGNYDPGHGNPNKPPTLTVTTAQTATVGSPLTLTALVVDDGLPKPRAVVAAPRPAPTPGGFGAQVNSAGRGRPTGLTANWLQYAGPAKVTFDHTAPMPVANGQAVTTAQFAAPGTYKLIASTNDGQLTTKVEVTVTVTGHRPISSQP